MQRLNLPKYTLSIPAHGVAAILAGLGELKLSQARPWAELIEFQLKAQEEAAAAKPADEPVAGPE